MIFDGELRRCRILLERNVRRTQHNCRNSQRFSGDPIKHTAYGITRYRRLWLAIGWALTASVVLLSIVSLPVSPPQAQSDKVGHVIAYAVLMFWFCQLYTRRRPRFVLALALLGMGCGLEFVQHVVGRSFEYQDMLANAAGIVAGWAAAPPRTPQVLARIEARFRPRRAEQELDGSAVGKRDN